MNLENKKNEAIRILEDLGYQVILGKDNKVVYSQQVHKEKYCNNCEYCCTSLEQVGPDSFEMSYQVICKYLKVLIASYEPCDDTTTEKPLACPLLGRELNKAEEKEAQIWLKKHSINI